MAKEKKDVQATVNDEVFLAWQKVVTALEPLSDSQRRRVIRAACILLQIEEQR